MEIRILSFNQHKRLSIVQLASSQQNTFEYISGPSAISKNLIEVSEISSAGSVNNLKLTNHSDKYVFFMDGDILVGAKQNRVLNTSVFVEPKSNIKLPVSCVEHGRWRSTSSKFSPSEYFYPDSMRKKKSNEVTDNLRKGSGHYANQSSVWNEVLKLSRLAESYSETSALDEIIDKSRESIDSYISRFPLNKYSNGLAVFIDNKLISVDLFNRVDIYQEYFPKRLRGAVSDVINLKDKENTLTEAEAKFKTVDLFDKIEKMEYTVHNGVGVGNEKRYSDNSLTAMELSYYEHLIHFNAFNLKNEEKERP